MRSKNCCFAIVAASWLCAYMRILKDDELAKPKVMIQQLMKPLDESIMKQETFSERFSLTQEIIMKLYDTRSIMDSKKQTNNNDNLFSEQWKDITTKKWLSYDVAINLDEILKTCGPFWLMKNLVDQIMHTKFIKDMENTLDIAFAIMHLNIEACTETLLKDILISMLFNKNQ
jgi:mediator of RNA polymerase II transcription subunit 24